jgi:hypothetical protein
MPVTRAGHRWRTQVVGLWWLLVPLATLALDWWVRHWLVNSEVRWTFYLLRALGILMLPEVLPAVVRLAWPHRAAVGATWGLLVGPFASWSTFLLLPSERPRAINALMKIDFATIAEAALMQSFVTGGWLIGAVYLTFGRFRESPWRRQSQDPARPSHETVSPSSS